MRHLGDLPGIGQRRRVCGRSGSCSVSSFVYWGSVGYCWFIFTSMSPSTLCVGLQRYDGTYPAFETSSLIKPLRPGVVFYVPAFGSHLYLRRRILMNYYMNVLQKKGGSLRRDNFDLNHGFPLHEGGLKCQDRCHLVLVPTGKNGEAW